VHDTELAGPLRTLAPIVEVRPMQPIKPMGRAVASRITSMGARCTEAEASCRPTGSADRTSTPRR
jgi:hypothetical protein